LSPTLSRFAPSRVKVAVKCHSVKPSGRERTKGGRGHHHTGIQQQELNDILLPVNERKNARQEKPASRQPSESPLQHEKNPASPRLRKPATA